MTRFVFAAVGAASLCLAACAPPRAPSQTVSQVQMQTKAAPVVTPVQPAVITAEELKKHIADLQAAERNTMLIDSTPPGTRSFADNYRFETWATTQTKTEFTVKIVLYDSMRDLRASKGGGPWTMAYAYLPSPENDNTCTIHMVDPKKLYWPHIIGHEFTHCTNGSFHPSQQKAGQ